MLKRRKMINSKSVKSLTYKTGACIDIHCKIQAVPFAALSEMKPGEPSAKIRKRVIKARQIQEARFSSYPMRERLRVGEQNSGMGGGKGLPMAMERLKLSARADSRILKVG